MEQIAYALRSSERLQSPVLKPVYARPCDGEIPIAEFGPILIASPHPDDETLGCGGLIIRCAELGCSVTILAMTKGEASHPGDRHWQTRLAQIRGAEQRRALNVMGFSDPDIIELGLPDGGLESLSTETLQRACIKIREIIHSRRIKTLFVPAVDDCHADHQITAKLLADVARDYPFRYFFSYQIWPPTSRRLSVTTNEREYGHDISSLIALKRSAIFQHQSQLNVVDPNHTEGFRMPPTLLDAKLGNTELFALVSDPAAWSS